MSTVGAPDARFLLHRVALPGLDHRTLGSVADAEDVVSKTCLRWWRAERSDHADARAFPFSVTARLSNDALRPAQRRRSDSVRPRLPERLVTASDDPASLPGTRDTTSRGVLLSHERPDEMTPLDPMLRLPV